MRSELAKFKEKKIPLEIDNLEAKVVYHTYQGIETNTVVLEIGCGVC
jgi:tRNA G46 methylase TrmB